MAEFNRKSTWIHVIMPGQDIGDSDLPANYEYPSFQQLSEAIAKVLEHLEIKHTLLFGEGAGANILTRFAVSILKYFFVPVFIYFLMVVGLPR